MLLGYARVSTSDQDLTLQHAALQAAGCERIYAEKVSGAKRQRAELVRMLEHARAGDVVIVSRLDRLARSTRDLLEIADQLQDRGIGLRSLADTWLDTTSPAGRMILTVFAGIAEFERSLIQQRTTAGRLAAHAKGIRSGPKPKLNGDQRALCRRLVEEDGESMRGAAKLLGVSAATVSRLLAVHG